MGPCARARQRVGGCVVSKGRFGALAKAVQASTAAVQAEGPLAPSGSVHRPTVALGVVAEGLRDRVTRLEAALADTEGRNAGLGRELQQARDAQARAGDAVDEFLFLNPNSVHDPLPRDRMASAFEGAEFQALQDDIEANGQNDAITVRRTHADGSVNDFEVAAGRRRLEACRRLSRQVLARVRPLDDDAMLRVQFSENERREDISALERAHWFAAVKQRTGRPAKEIAAGFGLDPSTLSLYLRLSRFPPAIAERLLEPRRLGALRARRVMEAVEADPDTAGRLVHALEIHARACRARGAAVDGDEQVAVLLRAAEARGGPTTRAAERRHVAHDGRRIGTLTRDRGQWVFRFASGIGDATVQALADRMGELVAEAERAPEKEAGAGKEPRPSRRR